MKRNKKIRQDINHEDRFFQKFKAILEQPELSDVILIVEGCLFPAHKIILAAQSEYFRALLFGGLKESSQKEIVLNDADKKSFKVLLEYIYTARMTLDDIEMCLLLDVLELSQKWSIENLTDDICSFLKMNLAVDYLWNVHKIADAYGFHELRQECLDFANCNAVKVMQHESFLHLSPTIVKTLISQDTFFAPEDAIFDRLCAWISTVALLDSDVEQVFEQVRWKRISPNDFLTIPKALSPELKKTVLGMIVDIYNPEHSKAQPRGYGLPEVNVAVAERGAKVVEPNGATQNAVDGKSTAVEGGYTSHVISPNGDAAIVIELDREYLLNYFKLWLWPNEKCTTMYSYYIEVSGNQISWIKIVDYQDFPCFRTQHIHFDSRNVRYIKVVGTRTTDPAQPELRITAIQAYYQKQSPDYFDKKTGFIAMEFNDPPIQWIRNGDGDSADDCEHGMRHTWHWKIRNPLVRILEQPIRISAVAIFLFDPASKGGNYKVDISKDESVWKDIGSITPAASWKILKFDLTPLCSIRITRPEGVETTCLCVNIKFVSGAKYDSVSKK